jgi:Putative peptidoglycan binding domain/Protein of unknown function (DUF1236)
MKNRLLLSTAVVLAGVGFASAQNLPGNSGEGASHQGAAQQSEQHSPQSQQQRNASQGAQRQTGAPNDQHETTGQAPSSTKDQANQKSGRDQNSAAQAGERNKDATHQNEAHQGNQPNQGANRTNREPNQRTGQQGGERNIGQQPQQRTGQGQQGQDPNRVENQNRGVGRNAQQQQRTGQNQGQQGRGNINLTSEQRTKIRETMLNGRDVPRVDNVSFALDVGPAVPSDVRIVTTPETLIEVHPEWRGDSYFVVRDEIVIVDSGRHVVAMVSTGPSSARAEEHGGARGAMNLDRAQIREVQIELQRQGFDVGEPDGMLGPRTKEALMAFQRQRGFQASGEIDHDTFAALGRGRNETTGQAPRNGPPVNAPDNNPQSSSQSGNTSHNASESSGNNRPSAGQPSTTGQSSGNLNGREGNTSPNQNLSPNQREQRRNENPR